MAIHPILAFIDAPIIIGILVVGALLFGADKLPKLARSAGQAKKEFVMGQIEADERHFDADRSDVDDAAETARRHGVDDFLNELDGGDHVHGDAGQQGAEPRA